MDIFNIKDILKQIDSDVVITQQTVAKLNKYIMKLYKIFDGIQHISNKKDFFNTVDIMFYNLKLAKNIKDFCEQEQVGLIKFKFKNNRIQKYYAYMFEYIIYDLLDMMYSYCSINNENVLKVSTLLKIMNNDMEFYKLNQKFKIVFIEDHQFIPHSYFKKILKSILPERKFSNDFVVSFRKYIEYKIIYYMKLSSQNSTTKTIKKFINNNLDYKCNYIFFDNNVSTFHLT